MSLSIVSSEYLGIVVPFGGKTRGRNHRKNPDLGTNPIMAKFALPAAGATGSLNTSARAVGDEFREIVGGPSIAGCGGPDDGDPSVAAANIVFAKPTMARQDSERGDLRGDLRGDCRASILLAIAAKETGDGRVMGWARFEPATA